MRLVVIAVLFLSACAPKVIDAIGRGVCGAAPSDTAELTIPASSLRDSFGVNVRLAPDGSVYGDVAKVVSDLTALGIRHVRDDALGVEGAAGPAIARELGRRGIHTMLQLNTGSDVPALVAALGGALEAVQVPTPLDAGSRRPPVTETEQNTRAVRMMADTIALAARPLVVAPTLGRQPGVEVVGDLSAWLDVGAVFYPRPATAEMISAQIASARRFSGSRSLINVAGQHYPTKPGGSEPAVSLAVQARWVLRFYLEQFRLGIERAYYSRLYDFGDPYEYGLARADGTPKPSFEALSALASVLEDAGGPAPPVRLPLAVEAATSSDAERIRHLLLRRTDGAFVLLLWLEVDSVEAETTAEVTVRIGAPVKDVSGRRLRSVTEAVDAIETESSLNVVVTDHPQALIFWIDCP